MVILLSESGVYGYGIGNVRHIGVGHRRSFILEMCNFFFGVVLVLGGVDRYRFLDGCHLGGVYGRFHRRWRHQGWLSGDLVAYDVG